MKDQFKKKGDGFSKFSDKEGGKKEKKRESEGMRKLKPLYN